MASDPDEPGTGGPESPRDDRPHIEEDRRQSPRVDLMQEFQRFRTTLEKVGDMANDGLRAFNEFQQARSQSQFPSSSRASH